MKQFLRKGLSVLVSALLLLGVFSGAGAARISETEPCPSDTKGNTRGVFSGTCGNELTWSLDTDTGVLEISGSGEMYNYYATYSSAGPGSTAPWYKQYKQYITSVLIDEGVSSIGDNAFGGLSRLASISIPESVSYLGIAAFYYCGSLASVSIPNNVTSVGVRTFYECTSLSTVLLSNGITDIGNYAFYNCHSLLELSIPDGVTVIGESAFQGCSSLSILAIPDTVEQIGSCAFCDCSALRSVNVPDGITSIEWALFKNCTSLTEITIPESVTAIGNSAFCGCTSLQTVNIPSGLSNIESSTFLGCSSLKNITIPDGITSIGAVAFNGCSALSVVLIPETVDTIGNNAFDGCSSLGAAVFLGVPPVNTGNSIFGGGSAYIVYLDENSQAWCPNGENTWNGYNLLPQMISGDCGTNGSFTLDTVTGVLSVFGSGMIGDNDDNNIEAAPWFQYKKIVRRAEIGEGITAIGSNLFYECSNMTAVSFPQTLNIIGSRAFTNCDSLTSVEVPNGVSEIDNSGFIECDRLSFVSLPNSITRIGEWAFAYCESLVSINLPESITEIGEDAFYRCSSLGSIVIPQNLVDINDFVFAYCTSLESVDIPNNIKNINGGAFSHCTSLSSVIIGTGVEKLYWVSFDGCSSLVEAYFLGNPPTMVYGNAFSGCADGFTVYYLLENASFWAPNGETEWNGYPIAPFELPEPTAEPTTEPTAEPTATPTPTPIPENAVMFTVSKGCALPTKKAKLSVNINGEYSAYGLTLQINYDPELASFAELIHGELWDEVVSNGGTVMTNTLNDGVIGVVAIMPVEPLTTSGELFSFKLEISESAELDSVTPVTINVSEFYTLVNDFEREPIAFTVTDGEIAICRMQGDIDGSGEIDSFDALLVMRHALGLITLTEDMLRAADVSGDGIIDSFDALLIIRIVLGLVSATAGQNENG